jgi:hypothetical protein
VAFPWQKVALPELSATDFPGCSLELLDAVASIAQKHEDTIWAAHVRSAGDYEVNMTATQVLLNFWNPIAIARVDDAVAERRKIRQGLLGVMLNPVDIAMAPLRNRTVEIGAFMVVDQVEEQNRFALTIG